MVSINLSQGISNYSREFLNSMNLTTIGYKRVLSDGKYIFISSNVNWMDYHYKTIENHGKFFADAMRRTTTDSYYRALWPQHTNDHFLHALSTFNMWNGINFYKKCTNGIELWTFSTNYNVNNDPNFYINNIERIEKFLQELNFTFGKNITKEFDVNFALLKEDLTDLADPLKPLLKKFVLTVHGLTILVPMREMQCLALLSSGLSHKEVAYRMNVSPRTVEKHIKNLKIRTNIDKRSFLISIYKSNYGMPDNIKLF